MNEIAIILLLIKELFIKGLKFKWVQCPHFGINLINELQSSVFIYDDILLQNFKGNCVEMKMGMLMECTVIYSIY